MQRDLKFNWSKKKNEIVKKKQNWIKKRGRRKKV